jgi:hypothetical protein
MDTENNSHICGSAIDRAKGTVSLVVRSGIKRSSNNCSVISKRDSLSPKKRKVCSMYMYRPGIDPLRRRSFFPNIFGFPMIRAPREEMRHINIVNFSDSVH